MIEEIHKEVFDQSTDPEMYSREDIYARVCEKNRILFNIDFDRIMAFHPEIIIRDRNVVHWLIEESSRMLKYFKSAKKKYVSSAVYNNIIIELKLNNCFIVVYHSVSVGIVKGAG